MSHALRIRNLSTEIDFIENCIETSNDDTDLLALHARLESIVEELTKLEKLERIEALGLRLIHCQ